MLFFYTSVAIGWEKTIDCTGTVEVVEGIIGKDSIDSEVDINCFFVSDFFGVTGIHSFSVDK